MLLRRLLRPLRPRRIRRVGRLRLQHEASATVLLARVLLPLLRLRRLVGRDARVPPDGPQDVGATRGEIVGAVRRAAALWPRTGCLPEALAARWLGRLHGCSLDLVLGATRGPGTLAAHAWVEAGRVEVRPQASGGHTRLGVVAAETRP